MELVQTKEALNHRELVIKCAQVLDEKKAEDIILMDVKKVTPITDYFLVASAESNVGLNMLSDYVEEELAKNGIKRVNPRNPFPESPWILTDYGFIVVHLFLREARQYYGIEKFWHDAEVIPINI